MIVRKYLEEWKPVGNVHKCSLALKSFCLLLVLYLACCSTPQDFNWREKYETISYSEYTSEDYPYSRSLIRLEGFVKEVSEHTTTINETDVAGYIIILEAENDVEEWQCSYYTAINQTTFKRNPVLPVIIEPLELGESIVVYGYHDKNRDMDNEDGPVIVVVRLDYKGEHFQAIDQYGNYALTVYDPTPSQQIPVMEPMNFTHEEFIANYNGLANQYDLSPIDENSLISMNYAKGIRTYTIPNDRIDRFQADGLFGITFRIQDDSNLVQSMQMSFSVGYSSWDSMKDFNRDVALNGLAVAAMTADPQLTLEEAKSIIEQTQTKNGKNGKTPVLSNGLIFTGFPNETTHGITIRLEQEDEDALWDID